MLACIAAVTFAEIVVSPPQQGVLPGYLVLIGQVGRPITEARDPRAAAMAVVESLVGDH